MRLTIGQNVVIANFLEGGVDETLYSRPHRPDLRPYIGYMGQVRDVLQRDGTIHGRPIDILAYRVWFPAAGRDFWIAVSLLRMPELKDHIQHACQTKGEQ